MWENPYYFFRTTRMNIKGLEVLEEIKIDVTKSAWTKEISQDCKKVLDILLNEDSEYKIKKILDFGCGKLTSANYILKHKKKLTVVDFKEILDRFQYLEDKLKHLRTNTLFKKMEFPNPFISDSDMYDLGLLLQVLPVMPVFLERLMVLSLLQEKIRNKKYLLWYAMKNPSNYRKRERADCYWLGDGMWIGKRGKKKKEFTTFYKYHQQDYLIFIMYLCGFQFERVLKVPATDAILFSRTKFNFLKDILSSIDFNKEIPCKFEFDKKGNKEAIGKLKQGVIDPNPSKYSLYNLVKNIFRKIKPGNVAPFPNYFKRICAGIIQYLFSDQLVNMQIEDPMNDEGDFIDFTFQTTTKDGFFKYLHDINNIKCAVLLCEAKNYTEELTNKEFQQLFDRFNPIRGNFGFLMCRDEIIHEKIIQQIKKRRDKGFCIVLDDKEILKVLKIRIEDGVEGVNKFFIKKLKEILM